MIELSGSIGDPGAALDLGSLVAVVRLGIAGLIGLAVGTEREWSGRTATRRRFAGIRTFFLLGLFGGVAGLLDAAGYGVVAIALAACGGLFAITAYWMATRRPDLPLDGTTEAAALVVLALAFIAGLGAMALAGGAAVLVVFALAEKEGLHRFVARIDRAEMRAALQFAILAAIILPLLPTGPYPALLGLRPRALWSVVVLFSGLNFAGYLARRIIGVDRGYGLAGILGGILSSTAVTLQFSRASRTEPTHGRALALGVVGACTVLPVRVVVLSLVLNQAVALALMPFMLPAALAGIILVATGWRHAPKTAVNVPEPGNPLRLGSAIPMAAVFQLAMIGITYSQHLWGSRGLLGSALVLGLVDADALTASMTRLPEAAASVSLAARGIAIGILASIVFKMALAAIFGSHAYRRWALAGVGLIGGALLASILVLHAI